MAENTNIENIAIDKEETNLNNNNNLDQNNSDTVLNDLADPIPLKYSIVETVDANFKPYDQLYFIKDKSDNTLLTIDSEFDHISSKFTYKDIEAGNIELIYSNVFFNEVEYNDVLDLNTNNMMVYAAMHFLFFSSTFSKIAFGFYIKYNVVNYGLSEDNVVTLLAFMSFGYIAGSFVQMFVEFLGRHLITSVCSLVPFFMLSLVVFDFPMWALCSIYFMTFACVESATTAMMVYFYETVPIRLRKYLYHLASVHYIAGVFVYTLIMWLTNMHLLAFYICISGLLTSSIIVYFFVEESYVWLVDVKQPEQAFNIMNKLLQNTHQNYELAQISMADFTKYYGLKFGHTMDKKYIYWKYTEETQTVIPESESISQNDAPITTTNTTTSNNMNSGSNQNQVGDHFMDLVKNMFCSDMSKFIILLMTYSLICDYIFVLLPNYYPRYIEDFYNLSSEVITSAYWIGLSLSGGVILACIYLVANVETVLLLLACHVSLILLNVGAFLLQSALDPFYLTVAYVATYYTMARIIMTLDVLVKLEYSEPRFRTTLMNIYSICKHVGTYMLFFINWVIYNEWNKVRMVNMLKYMTLPSLLIIIAIYTLRNIKKEKEL